MRGEQLNYSIGVRQEKIIKEAIKRFDRHRIKLNECFFCGSVNAILLTKYDRVGVPCSVVSCTQCQFVFQVDRIAPQVLRSCYQSSSLEIRGKSVDKRSLLHLFEKRVKLFATKRCDNILDHMALTKSDLIFEIGCGDGANLFPFHLKGFDVFGIDIDKKNIEIARENGLNVVFGDYDDIEGMDIRPKVIILSHFAGHVNDIVSFLKKIKEMLSRTKGAILYLESPGYRCKQWLSSRSGILPYFDFEPLYYFDKKTLCRLMSAQGLYPIYCDEFVTGLFGLEKQSTEPEEVISSADYFMTIEREYQMSLKGLVNWCLRRAI